jgi:hypothetical protein
MLLALFRLGSMIQRRYSAIWRRYFRDSRDPTSPFGDLASPLSAGLRIW